MKTLAQKIKEVEDQIGEIVPFRPSDSQVPTFTRARHKAKEVMSHLNVKHLMVWTMFANGSVKLVKFNRNGSRKVLIED